MNFQLAALRASQSVIPADKPHQTPLEWAELAQPSGRQRSNLGFWGRSEHAPSAYVIAPSGGPFTQRAAQARLKRAEALRPKVLRLMAEWEEDCGHLSSTTQRVNHPAFRAIVAMGQPVIPLLLEQLAHDSGDWDIALHEITGENPVPPGNEGRMAKIVEAWLAWGVNRGYRPR